MASILFKVGRICNSYFKCNYLKKKKCFLVFSESTSNFKHFEKKMIVIANVFPKLKTVKMLFRQLSKKWPFRTRFDSDRLKV